MGVPYEVPALILAREVDEDQPLPKVAPLPRGPARLPTPNARFRRSPVAPEAPLPRAAAAPQAPVVLPLGGPPEFSPEDTASLVDDLATELAAKSGTVLLAPVEPDTAAVANKRKKLALIGLAVAAVLSVIVAVLPGGSGTSEVDVEAAAQESPPPANARQPVVEPDDEPARAEPEASPPPPLALGEPTDERSAAELYAAAEEMLAEGNAAEAHELAFLSWLGTPQPKTAELLTRTACAMQDVAKASRSLNMVGAARRPAVRAECGAMGIDL